MDFAQYSKKFKDQVLHNATGYSPKGSQHDLSNVPRNPINVVFNNC